MKPRIFYIGNSRAALLKALSLLGNFLIRAEDDYELVLRRKEYKRSHEQNRRYWSLLNEISEGLPVQGVNHSAEVWHAYFRSRFIGCEEIKMPNGKVFEQPISTTTLDVGAFSEYMTRIEAWAAQHGLIVMQEAA